MPIFNKNARYLKKIRKIVNVIDSMRDSMLNLSDEELKAKTTEFKERLKNGETTDDLLPEAFAVVKEASRRVLGMEPYDVQLMSGIVLHSGMVAEQKTGEGKTLVAALPSYLNALEGKGVHVVTVNDYLAKRDAEEIGQIHRFLGLTVGCILQSMNPPERQAAYACDITYVTNNEDGFDYLRDNMVTDKRNLVQRGLHYAIIDEVDSILIDEARTPLIISGPSNKPTTLFTMADFFAKHLEKGEASKKLDKMTAISGEEITETGDFIVDEKEKSVHLTQRGIEKAEKFFRIDNLASSKNLEIQHNINTALRANYMMFRDQDYVVANDEIMIVDSFTGRIMPGRRYNDGLHQAIEAKEKVKIQQDAETLATITFQNFFNKYDKKAGMTGTAMTELQEFRDIYGMDVIAIPTNKPVIRKDKEDLVYITKEEKFDAVIEEIKETIKKRQPVLVGTVNVDTSEMLSDRLTALHIPHQVLNAKFHEQEADIVSHAGEAGTVTIATNMAGRGTDIKLDDEAREAGGLKIIGTERHESRRIDNQLRGRSGRQGDPGESQFFISLDDDLMRLYSSDSYVNTLKKHTEPGEPITHRILSKAIEGAQKKIEGNNYSIRKSVMDFDAANNEQRDLIYSERNRIIQGDDMKQTVLHMSELVLKDTIEVYLPTPHKDASWDLEGLAGAMKEIFNLRFLDYSEMKKRSDIEDDLKKRVIKRYEEQELLFPDPEQMRAVERQVILKVIDEKWKDHLSNLEHLKEGINLHSFAQRDPKVEYKIEAYQQFEAMAKSIRKTAIKILYKIQVELREEENTETEE